MKIPLSVSIYRNEVFSRALQNRFNTIRARSLSDPLKNMKYDFNYVAG